MATQEEMKPAEWVKILSKDGHAFIVPREVAMMSGTLKNMLSREGGFEEASSNTCQIQERAIVAEKVVEYLAYKHYYTTKADKSVSIPEFLERIPAEIALELLMAADFLEA